MTGLVDTHCHLMDRAFDADRTVVLERARTASVGAFVLVGYDLPSSRAAIDLARRVPRAVASVGIHPNASGAVSDADFRAIEDLASDPLVVAIGETGLDYHRLSGDLEWQRQRFRTHIRAARKCHKPLVIHTRDAAEDTLRIMREEGASEVGGVMHCFTETQEVADGALALGFHISFSGIVTFKNATQLKEVARRVPLERLLVETDSPYLAPVPHRGKTNRPGLVRHVAEEVARLRGIAFEDLAEATSRNFFRLFVPGRT
jgi:TatD DNase family protein